MTGVKSGHSLLSYCISSIGGCDYDKFNAQEYSASSSWVATIVSILESGCANTYVRHMHKHVWTSRRVYCIGSPNAWVRGYLYWIPIVLAIVARAATWGDLYARKYHIAIIIIIISCWSFSQTGLINWLNRCSSPQHQQPMKLMPINGKYFKATSVPQSLHYSEHEHVHVHKGREGWQVCLWPPHRAVRAQLSTTIPPPQTTSATDSPQRNPQGGQLHINFVTQQLIKSGLGLGHFHCLSTYQQSTAGQYSTGNTLNQIN